MMAFFCHTKISGATTDTGTSTIFQTIRHRIFKVLLYLPVIFLMLCPSF